MKTFLKFSIILAAFASLATTARAQIDGPPGFIDYQGLLLNSIGGPITGAGGPGTTGTATNFEIRFRIWDLQTGGTLIWAEKQIVTVTDTGLFSVRLGEGEAITVEDSDPGPLSSEASVANGPGALLNAFDGRERFLGVTVMKPPDTPGEIQPRLAFLASPYAVVAEKAMFAEFGPSSAVFEADSIGVGTSSPGSQLEVVGSNDVGPTDATGLISSGPSTGNHIAIDDDEIQSYSDATTTSTLSLNSFGGNVGIGTSNPQSVLEVAGSNTLSATDGSGIISAGEITGLHIAIDSNDIQKYDDANTPGTLWLNGFGGDVRIGTAGATTRITGVTSNGSTAALIVNSFMHIDTNTINSTESNLFLNTISNKTVEVGNGGLKVGNGTSRFSINTTNTDLVTAKIRQRTGDIAALVVVQENSSDIFTIRTGGTNRLILHLGNAAKPGGGDWAVESDVRLKKDIEGLSGSLDRLMQLRSVTFKFKDPKESGHEDHQYTGFIAQEAEKVFPEWVYEGQDGYKMLGIKGFASEAVQALRELRAEKDEQLRERDEQIASLQERLERLEALILSQEKPPKTW